MKLQPMKQKPNKKELKMNETQSTRTLAKMHYKRK